MASEPRVKPGLSTRSLGFSWFLGFWVLVFLGFSWFSWFLGPWFLVFLGFLVSGSWFFLVFLGFRGGLTA